MNADGRSNPFEERPPEEVGAEAALPELLASAVVKGQSVVQIRGDCGMGKTTLLHAIGSLAATRGKASRYANVAVSPEPFTVPHGWVLLDESQLLDRETLRAWLALQRWVSGRMALGTHRSHGRDLLGMAKIVDWRLRPWREVADVRRLLATAGQGEWLEEPALARLLRESRGNTERILRIAYELVEDHGVGGTVTADDVTRAAERLRRDAPGLFGTV